MKRPSKLSAQSDAAVKAVRPRVPKPDYKPSWQREDELGLLGYAPIVGVDEAGRGPLAGPVVAGAVILPRSFQSAHFALLHDSKQLDESLRATLYSEITTGTAWGTGQCSAAEIDEINIRQASWLAMQRAVANLLERNECAARCESFSFFVLIDGLPYGAGPWPYEALVKGDARSFSIAAASVIAKETRDSLMRAYELEYPGYGFAQHKGYGTAQHLRALKELGPCLLHRRTFGPVRASLQPLS